MLIYVCRYTTGNDVLILRKKLFIITLVLVPLLYIIVFAAIFLLV